MGKRVTYECFSCDYTAQISAGPDRGMVAKTNTYLCLHCKEVVDVVTEHLTVVKTGESAVGKCPRCKSSEHITEWDTKKRPCPRCDGKMEYALTQRITLWD